MYKLLVLLLLLTSVGDIGALEKSSVANSNAEVAASVSLCELIENSSKYDSKLVQFRADILDGQLHGILLTEPHCKGGLRMQASDSVRRQADYTNFMTAFYEARAKEEHFSATFEGRFRVRTTEPRLKWVLDVTRISNMQRMR